MNDIVLTVMFVGAVTGILTLFSMRRRDEVWEAEVIDKKRHRYVDDNDFEKVTATVCFKTVDGKKKKISGNSELFDKYEVGDKVKKIKGEYSPEKV